MAQTDAQDIFILEQDVAKLVFDNDLDRAYHIARTCPGVAHHTYRDVARSALDQGSGMFG